MTGNLFDNAKFGDMFLTTENKQAVFLRLSENVENKFAVLYVEGWGTVQVFRHNGNEVNGDIAHSIIKKQEEPVSEDLEEVVKKLWNEINSGHEYSVIESYNVFYGLCLDIANWHRTQMMSMAIDGRLCSTISGSEQNVVAPAGYGEYGKDGDKVKVILLGRAEL